MSTIKQKFEVTSGDFVGPSDRAFALACIAHEGQKRADGQEYYTHLDSVANILFEYFEVLRVPDEQYEDILALAYLHDIAEDTELPLNDAINLVWPDHSAYQYQFYYDVLMDLTTVLPDKTPFEVKVMVQLGKAYVMDPVAALIKMADRLHNCSDMKGWSEERALRYLQSSRELMTSLYENITRFTDDTESSRIAAVAGMIKYEFEQLFAEYL